jgi:hypothetical protein
MNLTTQEIQLINNDFSISKWNEYKALYQKIYPNQNLSSCSCNAKSTHQKLQEYLKSVSLK